MVKNFSTVLKLFVFFLVSNANAQEDNIIYNTRFFGAPAMLATDLSGSGFTATQPSAGGFAVGLIAERKEASSPYALGFKFNHAWADFVAAKSVSPRIISYSRDEILFYASTQPFSSEKWKNATVGLGYGILNYEGANTTPNIVVTSQSTEGLALMFSNYYDNPELRLTFGFSLYLPYKLSEREASSGHNPKYMGTEFSVLLDFPWLENSKFFTGMIYRRDSVEFDGEGDRGSISGIDVRTNIFFPIGCKYDF